MKKIMLFLILLTSLLLIAKVSLANGSISLGPDVIGLDTNRDNKLSLQTIYAGQDVFLMREATPDESQADNVQKVVDPNGKSFVPLTVEELLKLASNRNHILTSDDLAGLKLHIYTARFLEGTNKIIVEREISSNIKSIKLTLDPNDLNTVITALDSDGKDILAKVIITKNSTPPQD